MVWRETHTQGFQHHRRRTTTLYFLQTPTRVGVLDPGTRRVEAKPSMGQPRILLLGRAGHLAVVESKAVDNRQHAVVDRANDGRRVEEAGNDEGCCCVEKGGDVRIGACNENGSIPRSPRPQRSPQK